MKQHKSGPMASKRRPDPNEPADVPVCRLMQRAHDLHARYPGQSRQALHDLIRYLTAIPPPKDLGMNQNDSC